MIMAVIIALNQGGADAAALGYSNEEKILYDPATDLSSSSLRIVKSHSELASLKLLIGNEDIKFIVVMKNPHEAPARSVDPSYHVFIVFETDNYWWSLEKTADQVLFQRAMLLPSALAWTRKQNETAFRKAPFSLLEADLGTGTTHDLIDFLSRNELLTQSSNTNCQTFAKKIFDRFAKTKYWSP